MQQAKIIDVTRSFIPIDPLAYPENLHSTEREDSPEKRYPVIPYRGYNFLPTAYGYKSYFGINTHLQINSLSPNKADRIFIFQTSDYRNILIALCDTGIWYKASATVGEWTQAIILAAPSVGAYYEWTFAIIKNKLYAYRNNNASFYKIESAAPNATPPLTITSIVPSFITMAAQLGMFKLGARLAFWDADNATAYASPDDYSDFTPSVLTGANVTTFNAIRGRISSIRPMGLNAVVYSSKSIVLLTINAAETFLVKAVPILETSGCAYARQAIESVPDSTHFAYTDTGIYKIENGKPELIIPEVYDYFKQGVSYPIYLNLMQGRFLAFEIMDADVLNGAAVFTKKVIPAINLIFKAAEAIDDINALSPSAENLDTTLCNVMSSLDAANFTEQKAAANIAVPSNLRKPGTAITPMYTCYLSTDNGPPTPIVWSDTPCGAVNLHGVNFRPAPTGDGGKLSKLTTDSSNKKTVTGAQAYIDGKWTMERFVQYQTALWKAQQKGMSDFMSEVLARTESDTLVTLNTNSCTVSNVTTPCTIGRYAVGFTAPQFGFNACSFWLTRYCNDVKDVINNTTLKVDCINTDVPNVAITYRQAISGSGTGSFYGSVGEVIATIQSGNLNAIGWDPPAGGAVISPGPANSQTISAGYGNVTSNGTPTAFSILAYWKTVESNKTLFVVANGAYPVMPTVVTRYSAGWFDKNQLKSYNNTAVPIVQVPVPETAYCEIVGWRYTDLNGNTATSGAVTCSSTVDKYPGSGVITRVPPIDAGRPNLLDNDGGICGLPYILPDGPGDGTPLLGIPWTDTIVNYLGATYLLQQGTIAPAFPTLVGTFVYDLHLKKWGKMKLDYKQLLDYSPINSVSNAPINFDTFGILAGVLKEDGLIYIFDKNPIDSKLTWGKIGYYRAGMTDLQEIRIDFKSLSTGFVETEVSLDGNAIGNELTETTAFNGVYSVIVYPSYSGKWFNITLKNIFDVVYMEFKGYTKGRR